MSKLDFILCDDCKHSENIHDRYDGRSKKDRECHAHKCRCAKFIKK